MSPEADALLDLAAVLSDGGAIDWAALEADAANEEERRELAALRAVADLVRAHDAYREETELEVVAAVRGLRPGRVLGDRYRIERRLGGGGMGEVWHAFDLKLGVEVALKALRPERITARRRELLRREVRAARRIVSPNVCRIYDLIEIDGGELISMEFVDGVDLAEHLRIHGPMPLRPASDVASQLLAGLQAIHDAGIVHRDLKPANVMITPAGRVVVMDFGVAKETVETGSGTIAGTPAYMAPEQLRGGSVDARTDLYAAALVLLELVHPVSRGTARDALAAYDGPWRDPLLRAASEDPPARYASARELDRALEAATLASGEKDERCPFPGLASFTEADRGYFFGREAEVETLGKKLKRLHMAAIVGPSGVGKTSLLRAGLIPSLPGDWAKLFCSPGAAPFVSLGEALVPHLTKDPEALRSFLRFQEPDVAVSLFRRWRRDFADAVLIVDQFEELFTQSPEAVEARFAELLGRLPLEADVRVLLSMRDDFLFRCHAHPGLRPILTELTLLPPLEGPDLRRALIHPALACGYRFEDDDLVDEIADEVERERGALPLLAFTASRLWEHRDRERGLLPRKAYWAIGGIGGSLAQHAEATLEEIGEEREPIVREMFRALITGQGTRVSRERDELLSVVEDRAAAVEVLDRLVEARLLTSFEAPDPGDPERRRRRVELVHESLLSHWPRLVRWRTQDADGAQFRDQLRQAAQLWDEGGRPDDMLWSGSVYQEYRLWRDRYPGSLTSLEESFAAAATASASRRKRRRALLVGSAIAALVAGLAVTSFLWRGAERAEARAVAEARRAEAEKLYTLSQNDDEIPNAVAYALAALELSDQPAYRRHALKLLLSAPVPFRLPVLPNSHNAHPVDISPDGKWLVFGWSRGGAVEVYSLLGGEPRVIGRHDGEVLSTRFSEDSSLLVTTGYDGKAKIWSVPEGTLLRTLDLGGLAIPFLRGADRLLTYEAASGEPPRWREWSLRGGEGRVLGRTGATTVDLSQVGFPDVDPSGRWAIVPRDRELVLHDLDDLARGPVRVLGSQTERVRGVRFRPNGGVFASFDDKGEVRLWSFDGGRAAPLTTLRGGERPLGVEFARRGSRLVVGGIGARMFDLAIPGAAPEALHDGSWKFQFAFDPSGGWLVSAGIHTHVEAWPLTVKRPVTLAGSTSGSVRGLLFAPDGSWVAASSFADREIKLWPIDGGRVGPPEVLFHRDGYGLQTLRGDDLGRSLLSTVVDSTIGNGALIRVSLPDREVRVLPDGGWAFPDAVGRRVVGSWWVGSRGRVIRSWDTVTGAITELATTDEEPLGFARDGRLLMRAGDRLSLWDVATSERDPLPFDLLEERPRLCPDRETLFLHGFDGRVSFRRLDGSGARTSPVVVAHEGITSFAADSECRLLVFGRKSGDVDVVATDTGEIHGMPLHDGWVVGVAVDPLGRFLSSSDGGVKLWEIPSGPAILDLPREEFLAKLRAMTNLRAIRDDAQPTGYAIRATGIPDWANPPRW